MLALCLVALAVLLAGCGRETGQILRRWTLEVPGAAPHAIDLPARLEGEIPNRLLIYRRVTTVALDRALVGRDFELVLPYLAFASLRHARRAKRSRLCGVSSAACRKRTIAVAS